jgi:hypothetical protein
MTTAYEQSDGSEEKTWRRTIQNTEREAAQEREAEVCKRLAISAFRKFSFPYGDRLTIISSMACAARL